MTRPRLVCTTTQSNAFIDVRGLQKVYPSPAGPVQALKGIDIRVECGEVVAVIGKSGSGKSSFINMLTGIDRPSAGIRGLNHLMLTSCIPE